MGGKLQSQIDGFVKHYNEKRPHQARGCAPMRAWRELDKATPELDGQHPLTRPECITTKSIGGAR